MINSFETWGSRLEGFDLSTLENAPDSIFGLTKDLRLAYFNPAWFHFAAMNDGEPAISDRFGLGTPIAEALVEPAREFYLFVYQHLIESGATWSHDYECSSAEVFRLYHQTIYPLHSGDGLLVVNSLVRQSLHDPAVRPCREAKEETYTEESGRIVQCTHCRRTKRLDSTDTWDWVPDWVKRVPEQVSHSLCPVCRDYYYKHHETLRQL